MRTESENAPFFIVGSGRSGSTLLRLILDAHSRICIPPETWFLLDLVDRLPLDRPLEPEELQKTIDLMTGHYRWPDLGIDRATIEERLSTLERPGLGEAVGSVYGELATRAGKPRWGDKTPPYVRIVPQLARLFPDARFLHLLRDGRDVALSFRNTGWHGPWLHRNTTEWRDAVRAVSALPGDIRADRLLEVRYEELVVSTEATIRRICEFLGERFDPAMLAWDTGVGAKVPEREAHAHTKLGRKPQPSDLDRWRRELPARELLIVEAHLAPELRACGYTPHHDRTPWRPFYPIVRAACAAAVPVIMLARRGVRLARRLAGRSAPRR